MPIDWQRIHQNGWRQGSVFTLEDSATLLEDANLGSGSDGSRLVVASHSCDVVARTPLETHVELCPAIPLAPTATVQAFGAGRDPRKLRIPIDIDDRTVLHELVAPKRFSIPRDRLETLRPDPQATLPKESLFHFEYWLSIRYRRRAFPNAFDLRLGTDNHKKIRKALSKVAPHVQHLLYSLHPQAELPDGEDYRLRVVILCRSKSMQDPQTLDSLVTLKDRLEEVLEGAEHVVSEVHLVGDERMTYAQFESFDSWGFEDLSVE